MDRRRFVTGAGAVTLAALAGCLGGGGDNSSSSEYEISEDAERHSIGDAVTYGGLEFTVADPVLVDHYAPYDCSGGEFWEDNEATQCTPPEVEDFESPPTQGGRFMALQITVKHVADRRIQLPVSADNFELINDGYAEQEFLVEEPWVSASYVFPSYRFFVEEHSMNEQGVFPGVAVRGYIAYEVPIESDLNQYTAAISWSGNADESQTAYWDITEGDVTDHTEASAPDIGGDVFYEQRGGGVQWGDDGNPEPPEDYENSGVRWAFDGEGEAHIPESQNETSTDTGS